MRGGKKDAVLELPAGVADLHARLLDVEGHVQVQWVLAVHRFYISAQAARSEQCVRPASQGILSWVNWESDRGREIRSRNRSLGSCEMK